MSDNMGNIFFEPTPIILIFYFTLKLTRGIKLHSPSPEKKTDNDYVISFIKNLVTAHFLAHVPLQVNNCDMLGEAIDCYSCKKN